MKLRRRRTSFLVHLITVFLLSQPFVSHAISITTSADWEAAINGLPGPGDPFFVDFQNALTSSSLPLDVNALVQEILREAYLESSADLAYYAEKVQYFNDLKEGIRDYLGDLRGSYSEFMADAGSAYESDTGNPLILDDTTRILFKYIYTNTDPITFLPDSTPEEDVVIVNTVLKNYPVFGEHVLTPVPEPSTLLLFGTGLVGIGIFRRKFKG